MSLEKMELLESRVRNAVEVIAKLKSEKSDLEQKMQELEKELSSKKEAFSSLQQEKERLDTLIKENQKLEEERGMIKSKIESMISNLEELDLG